MRCKVENTYLSPTENVGGMVWVSLCLFYFSWELMGASEWCMLFDIYLDSFSSVGLFGLILIL